MPIEKIESGGHLVTGMAEEGERIMSDNEKVTHISVDEFNALSGRGAAGRKGGSWASKYKLTLRRLKVGEAIVLPCIPSCSWSRQFSAAAQVNLILGSGNYQTKHLEKRGTPDNHIAVMKLHEERV